MNRYAWLLRTFLVLIAFSAASVAAAQSNSDPLGASLGLTPAAKSLPLWAKPTESAVQDMARNIKTLQDGVLLVGHPEVGTGTAFVISRRHRLLATNAHVADIMHEKGTMMAIRNGTAVLYEVDKAWYHPGVRRFKNPLLSVRSQNPAEGEVDPDSPDVAVLHLAEGADLPQEFALATVEEEENCFGQPIGMLGYPGHDTEEWPKLGGRAQATLREGIICRQSDFYGDVSGPPAEMQKLQHSLASWPGFSGSPLFLANGHVTGLHNSGRGINSGNRHVELAYGVRIDCLWELLAYHHLDDKVAIVAGKSKLLLDRYNQRDPVLEKYNQAAQLVSEAEQLNAEGKYTDCIEKCSDAIKVCPGYSHAYFIRGIAYTVDGLTRFPGRVAAGDPVNEVRLKLAKLAREDAHIYVAMNPNDPEAFLFMCMRISDVDLYGHTYDAGRQALCVDTATKLINEPSLPKTLKARAYLLRANVKTHDVDEADMRDEIYADYAEAIRLDPYNGHLWKARAMFDRDGTEQRTIDNNRSQQLIEAQQFASTAWRLATAADDKVRDGHKAWDLANKACQATEFQYANYLGALAAAYAACDDFDHAAEYARKAIQFGTDDEKSELREQLTLYKNKKPYRE